MRKTLSVGFLCLAIAGCGNVPLPTRDDALQDNLRNPLYAEFYYDDLTQLLVTLALREHPRLKEPGVRAVVDRTRTRSLQKAQVAIDAQKDGRLGSFLSDEELVLGDALLLENVLYFGPTFDSAPGPSLQVYLTTVIDPRDAAFPDASAVHLGPVKDQYGAQSFVVPTQPESAGTGAALRTAVLWDDELGLIYGFAQLVRVQ